VSSESYVLLASLLVFVLGVLYVYHVADWLSLLKSVAELGRVPILILSLIEIMITMLCCSSIHHTVIHPALDV
jgi:biotin transporter BioY